MTSINEIITLRMAVMEDMPALAAMAGKIFWETFTGKMPEEDLQTYIATAFSPDHIFSEYNDPASVFIIASYDGQWAGYAKINTRKRPERPEPERYIEIERLYILGEYHGRKIGAGLMDTCLQYARDHGFRAIWLNVWEKNTRAIEFYQRMHFTHVDWCIFMRGNDPQKA